MNLKPAVWIIFLTILIIPILANAAGVTCPRCGAIEESGGAFCGQCGGTLQMETQPPRNLRVLDAQTEIPPLGALDPSVQQLIGQLSDQDLRRIVALMLQRIEARQDRFAPDPNSVAMMSRQDLEDLLQRYSTNKPIAPKTSSFAGFLQFVGGTVLIILAISIIVSL